ncbi:hypothetical protein, partial [Streptomyces sp. AC154]|uniref:hypothetical protein n=1 Tax=Streptomyces sp. AC154 TaxID=3143184 RepID=UPI003F8100DB
MGGAGREHGHGTDRTDPVRGHVPEDAPAHADLVAVRVDRTAPAGGTTVLRLLSLLPPHWDCAPRSVTSDRIVLRIAPGPSADRGEVRRAVRGALAD